MSRALLQSDDANIFRQEVETSIGSVLVGRILTDSASTASTAIVTYTTVPDTTVRVRTVTLARQIANGTVGDSASYESVATFKNVSGTVTQVGSTTAVVSHSDSADWGIAFTVDGGNVVLSATLAGSTLGADVLIRWNSYLFIHSIRNA
jgi:hypothetical protein